MSRANAVPPDRASVRLNRYLARCGLGSRRQCDELIRAGRVRVNGEIAGLARQVEAHDHVQVDGRVVSPQRAVGVWMLHKPAGVVCTATDLQGRSNVIDLARSAGIRGRIFPVGRLDLETTGLLLLTDDGDLCFKLTHPAWGVEKEYEAWVAEEIDPRALAALRNGVQLEDGRTAPCRVEQECRPSGILVRLVLHEGRKRQVRRMLAAVGHPVVRLHRVRVGPLHLGALPPGAFRQLVAGEIEILLATLAQASQPPTEPPDE